ncbi:MAG: iron ABC transporter permease [Thermomicrobiales bacterium]|nr:iron ABC transporter permease [Thermomicrobiales bacterium]
MGPGDTALRLSRDTRRRPGLMIGILAGLIVVACLISVNMGFIQLSPLDVLRTLAGQGTERQELILFQFRLPRIALALLIGAGLAVSGGILQAISRNPLADPGILGINAGAGLAVVLLLLVFPAGLTRIPFAVPFAAIVGALVTAAAIYVLAIKDAQVKPSRLVLVGIAVGFGIGAAMLLLSLRMDRQLYAYAVTWLAGTISGTDWPYVRALVPWVAILVPVAIWKATTLNILNLGDQVATGLGVSVERQRLLLLATAVGLAGASVSVGGGITFVGLVAPHLARQLVGPRHQVLLPAAALLGALLLVVSDIIAGNLLSPVELPVGVVVAAVGAPYFLYLLARTTG